MKRLFPIVTAILAVALIVGCGNKGGDNSASGDAGGAFEGKITIDGSSTVYPITLSVAEEFSKLESNVDVTVSYSGTGGGFKKFYAGETQISDASRPIKSKEADKCKEAGIGYIELPVAYDGLGVYVNPENDWCSDLTTAELKKIWHPDSTINNWKDVRTGFPDVPLVLCGPGPDSGTFDYFTEAINGESQVSRNDYSKSEDDNRLVNDISTNRGALGYFGLAYYEANKDKMKLIGIDDGDDSNGEGPIWPSIETVGNGTYQPLSRPIFIYVSVPALEAQPEVEAFVNYYLNVAGEHSRKVGYVPLPNATYDLVKQRFANRVTGSMFSGGAQVGVTLDDLMKAASQQ